MLVSTCYVIIDNDRIEREFESGEALESYLGNLTDEGVKRIAKMVVWYALSYEGKAPLTGVYPAITREPVSELVNKIKKGNRLFGNKV